MGINCNFVPGTLFRSCPDLTDAPTRILFNLTFPCVQNYKPRNSHFTPSHAPSILTVFSGVEELTFCTFFQDT